MFIAGFAAACSSDSTRFGENPFGNPFQDKIAHRSDGVMTGSITPARRPKSSALPESNAGSSSPTYLGKASNWSAEGGTPVTLANGDTVMTLANRYGVPPQAILQANGLHSASEAQPGRTLVIPVYRAAGVAGPGAVETQPLPPRPAPAVSVAPPHPAVAMHSLAPVKPPALGHVEVAEREVKVEKKLAEHEVKAEKKLAEKPIHVKSEESDDEDEKPAKAHVKPQVRLSAKAVAPMPKPKSAKPAGSDDDEEEAAPVKPLSKRELTKPEAKAKLSAVQPKPEAKARLAAVQPKPEARTKVAAVQPVPAVQPAEPAPVQQPVHKAEDKAAAAAPAPARDDQVQQTGSLPQGGDAGSSADFRWPARGRVISAYSKGGNDGINIAVPEGTPVRSADGGVVAYAGSELKGYGNLVLIRHPNGFVSAYAHNGDLMVKRGQTVSRGQVIAKSGQTGNVSSPQLHFELRKGATPVDPTPYLN